MFGSHHQDGFAKERPLFEPGQLRPQADHVADQDDGRRLQAGFLRGRRQISQDGFDRSLAAGRSQVNHRSRRIGLFALLNQVLNYLG